MHKKLKKYIDSYDTIEDCQQYSLIPNGGMIVLINQEIQCKVIIDNISHQLDSFQAILINAYEEAIDIQSNQTLKFTAIRFKGAGASFFYDECLDELIYNPKDPIFLEKNIQENQLDTYLLERLKVGTIPFNIMKIIDLLNTQGSSFNIDEVLAIANVPRRILDKTFRLRAGLSFKTYASIKEKKN